MIEIQPASLPDSMEQNSGSRRFILMATEREVGSDKPRTGEYPHFGFPMEIGEVRVVDNFALKLEESRKEENAVEVSMISTGSGLYGLTLDDLIQEGEVLHVGSIAEIVFRRFNRNGRFRFHASAPIDIRIYTLE